MSSSSTIRMAGSGTTMTWCAHNGLPSIPQVPALANTGVAGCDPKSRFFRCRFSKNMVQKQ